MDVHPLKNRVSARTSTLPAIAPLNKGVGFLEQAVEHEDIAQLSWNLLREDLSLPAAVLYKERILHNLNWMHLSCNCKVGLGESHLLLRIRRWSPTDTECVVFSWRTN